MTGEAVVALQEVGPQMVHEGVQVRGLVIVPPAEDALAALTHTHTHRLSIIIQEEECLKTLLFLSGCVRAPPCGGSVSQQTL